MRIKEWLLIVFIIVFPFNLVIGRIVPETVSLPFYIADALLLCIGFFILIDLNKVEERQKMIVGAFALFFFWCLLSIIFHWDELTAALTTKEATYEMFKKILSDNILHIINKIFHLFLAFILFIAVLHSSLKKEKLLQYTCIPLFFIIIANIFLAVLQHDVQLDGGKAGTIISPYSITEIGRTYFPFVNSLLLSMYLSVGFFFILYVLLNEKHKQKKMLYGIAAFLLLLALDFTKGRTALVCVLGFYALLIAYFWITQIHFPKKIVMIMGIFLILLNAHAFLFHNFSFLATFNTFFNEQKILQTDEINEVKELRPPVTEQLTGTETEQPEQKTIKEYLTQTYMQITSQYYEFHNRRRTYHWPTAITLFQQHPFRGVGTGAFFYNVLHSEKDALCKTDLLCPDTQQSTDITSTAHSIYLQILAENGIIGLFLFMLLIGLIIIRSYKNCKNSAEIIIGIALLCFLLQGFLFSYFEYPEMTYIFWFLVGISIKNE